ncbi:sulfate adenylyltransferase subunit 1 [Catenovulum agarivorans DS-2]|uniref:Sulfate adenylyltransferase subunit 1 n=1 Tax=Catenovulum agarivorans DS-2 TaxID=1328313 RepID=W7QB01_9ALTE|nr:sulfate adenylyltransferase subunit CysN [Catenovulum agarivorans]EWH10029.1 sulfate adenylyltransferase subunit 1 [Catenovulum agarivorans DS-2]
MSHQSDLIEKDILAYLKEHENKELLRFLTCGSVDDGKSTLIGRLLHDSKMIYEDQLAAITQDSKKSGTTGDQVDLALLVDGLQSEREQGITIDVAYRYFSTSKRKFIIADTPGHEQYTRNMATGASTCDLAIILIDARAGVKTQTKRHSFIVDLLGIKHVVVAVNKMDLVDYSEDVYNKIKEDYLDFAQELNITDIRFAPMSALKGDNVVNKGDEMPWYEGETLMQMLESVQIAADRNLADFRMPVQYVNRPHLNYRGFAGTIASGIVRVGDEITAMPSGKTSKVKSIDTFDGELKEAFAPMSVTLTLEDEIDISRGDVISSSASLPKVAQAVSAHIVWMAEDAMQPGKMYDFKLGTKTTSGQVNQVDYRINVNTLAHEDTQALALNEIGVCEVQLNAPVVIEQYEHNRALGSFIVIDRLTNVTVGAGMIIQQAEGKQTKQQFSEFELELNQLVRKHFPHWQAVDLRDLLK